MAKTTTGQTLRGTLTGVAVDNNFDERNPSYQVRILDMKVEALSKQKDELEKDVNEERIERRALDVRVAKMEKSFQRGAGMMVMLPIIGTIIGIVVAYAKFFFGNSK